jgi:osmoprotectant transport system permease protein
MTFTEFHQKFVQQYETLPERLGGHIGLSLAAMAVGILISLPLGVWVSRRPKVERIVLMAASVIQTIPSLALLAIMVFAFQTIGWIPAWIALILYSILPMLRNTVTGMRGIDPAYIEAAKGIGMNGAQTLRLVELPLALPSIVAGIRTASVWVVGAATLAQPVGATSLGNYIFVGLQTWNIVAIVFGCLFSAILAIAFDSLLHGLEVAARKRSGRLAGAMGGLIALLAVSPFILPAIPAARSAGPARDSAPKLIASDDAGPFIVSSKAFSESYILRDVIRRALEQQGLQVETRDGLGSTIAFNALKSGNIDCYVDYTGTIWTNYMKNTEVSSPIEILIDVSTFLKDEFNVISLGSLGFSNDYVFMMRKEDAQRLGIRTLVDLAKHAGDLKAAADIEFFGRPEWFNVRSAYGIRFKESLTMDPTLMYGALENKNVDVIVGFRTDGRVGHLFAVEDPKSILPPYDGILLVSNRLARNTQAMRALRPLVESIPTELMRRMNALVDIEKKSVPDVGKKLFDQLQSNRSE